jgi:hypothetical protein
MLRHRLLAAALAGAADLVGSRVDVIACGGTHATRAANEASKTIPADEVIE